MVGRRFWIASQPVGNVERQRLLRLGCSVPGSRLVIPTEAHVICYYIPVWVSKHAAPNCLSCLPAEHHWSECRMPYLAPLQCHRYGSFLTSLCWEMPQLKHTPCVSTRGPLTAPKLHVQSASIRLVARHCHCHTLPRAAMGRLVSLDGTSDTWSFWRWLASKLCHRSTPIRAVYCASRV